MSVPLSKVERIPRLLLLLLNPNSPKHSRSSPSTTSTDNNNNDKVQQTHISSREDWQSHLISPLLLHSSRLLRFAVSLICDRANINKYTIYLPFSLMADGNSRSRTVTWELRIDSRACGQKINRKTPQLYIILWYHLIFIVILCRQILIRIQDHCWNGRWMVTKRKNRGRNRQTT